MEITIFAVAKQLAKLHSVTVVSRSHSRYPRHSVVDGVHIYRVPSGGAKKYLAQVRRFLRGKRYDLIQIDNRPRFVAPIKRMFPATKVSLFLHSLTFVSLPYASRSAARLGLNKADLIFANSSSLQQELSRRFPRAAKKITRVWLGVDTRRFRPPEPPRKSDVFTVLFTGRLIPRKGVPVLLKAVHLAGRQTLKPIKVIIAGGSNNPNYAEKMRALADSLGVNADFLGTVPHRRIHLIYRKADVFVCPSQKHEAFGLVNVEAMASGLPVIASSLGGIKEIVHHGNNGLLVLYYREPQAFANALIRLMQDPDLMRQMKYRARADCVASFSWSATAKRLSRIYTSG
ncbi:glycosyltransferase family 4 protein [Cohnella pontilimi]|uniref:glycosyltransferase family 4 protein n=1 Tax=Cohnella pontilimi TaxID=2564100 RepID=UPI001FE8EA32|nr:glycosyltransferase family 4 protein [Cohnella pontilimi]